MKNNSYSILSPSFSKIAIVFSMVCLPQIIIADVQQLRIKDCSEEVRVVETLTDGELVGVTAHSSSSTASTQVVLTSGSTTVTEEFNNGSVDFSNVTAGDWTLCTTPQKVQFDKITITRDTQDETSTTTKASIVGLSAAGALAVIMGDSSGGGDGQKSAADNTANTETNSPTTSGENNSNQTQKLPDVSSGNQKEPCDTKNRSRSTNPCWIGDDDEVEPISPFE